VTFTIISPDEPPGNTNFIDTCGCKYLINVALINSMCVELEKTIFIV
jgi:hypothetical protein